MPLPLKPFYMIRHGETEANKALIMAGSTDSPLTQKGRKQADQARFIVQSLDIQPSVIFHSHLSRARDTAHIINQDLCLDTYETEHYAEWHAGDWEGVPYDQCFNFLNEWPDPPNGETETEFLSRIQKAKRTALSNHIMPLVVSHGGVFRAFGRLYGMNSNGVDNCVLYRFTPDHMNPQFPWLVDKYSTDDTIQRPVTITRVNMYDISDDFDIVSNRYKQSA